MIVITDTQGTEEWKQARCGMITASRISDVMARTKSGYSASRKNYLAELLVERMTDTPTESFVSREMEWGTIHEPDARTEYEIRNGVMVDTVGLVGHPDIETSGASPDGLVGDYGGIEVKCPNTATHIETIITRKIPIKYFAQIQWCMDCTGRTWWDYVSYDPRMRKPELTMCIIRVNCDEEWLVKTRAEVATFETELQEQIKKLEEYVHDNN